MSFGVQARCILALLLYSIRDAGHYMQVRQKLYKTSIRKWKQYADHMEVAAKMLQPLIQKYEQDNAAYLETSVPSRKDEL